MMMQHYRFVTELSRLLAGLLVVTTIADLSASADEIREPLANAALQYWQAFSVSPDVRKKSIWNASSDDKEFGYTVPIGMEQARFIRQGKPALLLLHRGARMPYCEWGVDLAKDGLLVTSLHGEKARGLASLAMLRARWRFEHDQWDDGIDDIIATMIMGRHIGRDNVHYNINFGCMIENLCVSTAAVYLQKMPDSALTKFSQRLELLPSFTLMRDDILNWEKTIDWGKNAFVQAEKEGRLRELLSELLSPDEADSILMQAKNASGLVQLAEDASFTLRECAELAKLSPQEYERQFKLRIKPAFKKNPVVAMFVSSFDIARGEEATAHCRLEFLKAGIDVVSSGAAVLKDHPDPYGTGPFGYEEFDGGFELQSKLFYFAPIRLDFGLRHGK